MGKSSAAEYSGSAVLLHGDLDIGITEAKCLPNMDIMSERMRRCFTGYGAFGCGAACGGHSADARRGGGGGRAKKIITSDPYVSVCLAGATVAQTRVIPNSENPRWEERFRVEVAHAVVRLEFHVKDNDVFGAQLIGVASLPVDKIASGAPVEGWFPIDGHCSNPTRPPPELRLSVQYMPIQDNPLYRDGADAVPNAYFPIRRGGSVTLYQDAHVADGGLPPIEIAGGRVYEHGRCWEDICHSIVEAHHLVYMVGWSIYHPVKLVREPTRPLPGGTPSMLGELLKGKAHEGVRVVILLWDDKTSHDKFLLKTDGVMHTHDEETKRFFRHSGVHCVLVPRYASTKLSIFKQQVVGTLFTHHQKCVILDTQATGNNRKITAFIGGLDLCDGRYDTPEHRLFKDLDTVFNKDFHNPTFPVNSYGPRQPWHDLHCKVEGPAAFDILTNFEQRWRKATKWKVNLKKVASWHHDTLIKINRMSWIVTPAADEANAHVCDEKDPENWHVQVFRSIDSGSVKGFPKIVQEAELQNLVCAKNLKIDKSIHSAYVKAIRSAQHFIYIENQYFIGSSFLWSSHKSAGADNLIPVELALKIASKIKANEQFAVYIVLPMWPEGIPTTAPMQQILFWQGQTMSSMYKIIADALQMQGLLEAHPQDYLNFYCLGKRELAAGGDTMSPTSICNDNSALRTAQKLRRFMIYVHSKGMVVDDEYVIIGSANINQRSMEGCRDTEIAMGGYQPHYKWSATGHDGPPRGQVYGYRMSLWAEHLGGVEEWFRRPETGECVRRVNEMAEENWRAYVSPEMEETRGHLMRYPVKVDRDGRVRPLQGHECFPDVGGKVLGTQSSLPNALTT
ncbi:phospholipase D delta-like [Oryza brachyantha]|uniref:phospholipase D delta-like n=1 Tax=Oryza brachyantha TaxID=4533 RepID=UPI001ADC5EAC|nr:phospholipase D delta-like [Oryza brachyantha]